MTQPLIGLIGYSRVGKDEFADVFVQDFNALRVSQGDHIKQHFSGLLNLTETPFQLVERLRGRINEDAFWEMYFHHGADVVDYARSVNDRTGVDAFTQVDAVKDRLRPLLEKGGYVILPVVEAEMWANVHAYPGLVINSRLFDVPQCEAWRAQGGLIWELHRPGVGPKTEYEDKNMREVRAAGLVNANFTNAGTLGDWHAQARRVATQVMTQITQLSA